MSAAQADLRKAIGHLNDAAAAAKKKKPTKESVALSDLADEVRDIFIRVVGLAAAEGISSHPPESETVDDDRPEPSPGVTRD